MGAESGNYITRLFHISGCLLLKNWVLKNSGTTNNLYSVKFFDNDTGWIVGDFGKILKTETGGDTWISQSEGTTKRLESIYSVDSLNAWVVGSDIVLHSSNGGSNWNEQFLPENYYLLDVCFTDSFNFSFL